jgi:carboxyl-terminal processing protease
MNHSYALSGLLRIGHPFLLLLLIAAPAVGQPVASEQAAALVDRIVPLLERSNGDAFWMHVNRLEGLGKAAVPSLRAQLSAAGEKARLGCAKALLHLGDLEARREALQALSALARKGTSQEIQIEAIQILGLNEDPDEVLPVLEEIFDKTIDPQIVIPLARTLWEVDHVSRARDRLVDLLRSKDIEVRHEAALTLAELDYYEGEVREILRSLKKEPTPRGRRAATLERMLRLSRQLDRGLSQGDVILEGTDAAKLLKIKEQRIRELEDHVERASRGAPAALPQAGRAADPLLEEVIRVVQRSYVEDRKTSREQLLLAAIKGLVRGLDEHSAFLDADESRDLRQSLQGEYPGIGAQVTKPPGAPLEISRPIYGGPAYKEGILSGDQVLEVGGVPTDDLQLEELVDLLKGPEGTTVVLKVMRRGWTEPRELMLTRQKIEVPSVYHELLPAGIGYLHVTQFGDKSADEFIAALEKLEDSEMEGLIIDLRNNPGGRLDAAVRITDLFVKGKLPIVTQKGRGDDGENEKATYPTDDARSSYPIVVLVNERSASASEIVGGALQDHGRARLVGKRTFGKGTVQNIIALSSKPGCKLKLTVQYYYLPLGRCIHTIRDENGRVLQQGGVEPDLVMDSKELAGWHLEERQRLRKEPLVVEYADRHFEALSSLLPAGRGTVANGAGPPSYPELESLHQALGTPGDLDDVRAAVRYNVQRRLEDQRGRQFTFDLEEDHQLQRAILELLKEMKREPAELPEYAWFEGSLKGSEKK